MFLQIQACASLDVDSRGKHNPLILLSRRSAWLTEHSGKKVSTRTLRRRLTLSFKTDELSQAKW